MRDSSWEVTFSDMLMLLLTFIIFIISVSVFKDENYKNFWKEQNGRIAKKSEIEGEKASTKSNIINPFPELNIPKLSVNAERVLRQTSEIIDSTNEINTINSGSKIYYDENRISLMISEEISFGSGKSVLKKSLKSLLLKIIPLINSTDFPINITGHTDSTVSKKIDNLTLSLDRAVEIAGFLIENGLDSKRVSVSGYGPYRPLYSNLTKEGRDKNRRVQINIIINKPEIGGNNG